METTAADGKNCGAPCSKGAPGGPLKAKIADFGKRYSELEARYPRELSYKELSAQLLVEYERSLKPECAPSCWKDLSEEDLTALFHAVQSVAFYSETEPEARDLGIVFSEAERRKMDVLKDLFPRAVEPPNPSTYQSSMVKYLYKAYMSSRLFEEARLLVERYPVAGLPLPPIVNVSSGAGQTNRVYDFDGDGRSMTLRTVDWKMGQKIVAVFSPDCGFSRLAFDAITKDDFLLQTFEAHALMIAAPSDILQAKSYMDWNKERPALKGYIAYTRADWLELDLSHTPQFYFFKDGELIAHNSGWRRPWEDRKAELIKSLRSIGLAKYGPASAQDPGGAAGGQ